ncbi:MAG: metallophosphoesterase [Actinophytocola sp.]|uniref:metallophosphoesterase n=1 Tax=Actinophytocola sp. TaxID=1872138 RepID=UPI001329C5AC|nr:metallophosphoesterase [Actinophytocola sp.]MPZ81073.1 metallophosphoesterase [Actinophytocola sp.]
MFGVILSALVALMHFYVWKRLVKDTTAKGVWRRVGSVAFTLLAVLVFVTLTLGRSVEPDVARWFAWPGYIWFAVVVYLFLITLVLELPRLALRGWVRRRPLEATATTDAAPVTPAPDPEPLPEAARSGKPEINQSRRLFLARGAGLVAGAASVSLVGVGIGNALGPPDLLRVPVGLRRLDPGLAGFRIAVVSDIHLSAILGRPHTERVVRMINEQSPDLVAIVGDLADGTPEELGPAAEPLRDLVSREGSFFVTGNHEYFIDPDAWIRELDRLGVHTLRNERTTITRGGASLDLAGVTDVSGRSRDDGPDFGKALDGRPEDRPVVLMAHQPVQVSDAAERGVDLQLSGHTHGGQLYPFHHVVSLAQPSLAGLSKVDDTWLYVTRGAGFWGPPVRVGAPPDITVIELVR